jgi:hypothetical protein
VGLKIIPPSVQRPSSAVEARPVGYEGAWVAWLERWGVWGAVGKIHKRGSLTVAFKFQSQQCARGRRRCDARRRGISLVGLKGICGAIEVSRLVQLFYRFEKGRELRREGGIA